MSTGRRIFVELNKSLNGDFAQNIRNSPQADSFTDISEKSLQAIKIYMIFIRESSQ